MSSRLLRDEVMTIFLAGHDTTAAALSWMWLLLGLDRDAESRLQAELSSVLDGRIPGSDDLEHLPYATMIVKETLRLYPPISRIGRRPRHDIDLGTLTLPRDSAVFLSPYVTHRDPRWLADPDEFRPERWAVEFPSGPASPGSRLGRARAPASVSTSQWVCWCSRWQLWRSDGSWSQPPQLFQGDVPC